MKLIEREDKIYVKDKCIGTVGEVLERLLNAREMYEKYGENAVQQIYSEEDEQEFLNEMEIVKANES